MPNWTIRRLETYAEMEQTEQLQGLVWPGSEIDVTPAHVLITAAHNGGLVLGAWRGDTLIGLLFGFVGLYSDATGLHVKHCSHLLGIHPNCRNLGIGFSLKRAQRQIVHEQGLDLITWTYDPLLGPNAHLNIARLGAVCHTYLREAYGQMRDGLNQGLPSDRFQVDWWINTKRVEQRLGQKPGPHPSDHPIPGLYDVSLIPRSGLIRPPGHFTLPGEKLVLAEIPADFLQLKRADFELACAWRAFTREMFEGCFKAGYRVDDLISDRSGERPRCFYVLARADGAPGK